MRAFRIVTLLAIIVASGAGGQEDQELAAFFKQRDLLPEQITIPAAKVSELTPANGHPRREDLVTWSRSHGDAGSMRYSALDQINVANIHRLEVAWIYRSNDGKANIQCNPVIVNGVMYAPTAGDSMVAVNAETGKEIWRFRPEGRPAQRGLIYWPGDKRLKPRIIFLSSRFLYALDAATGRPAAGFGQDGRVPLDSEPLPAGIGVVAPAILDNIIVTPYRNVVHGLRVDDGEMLWSFHLIPRDGEFGRDTWNRRRRGVNCWGGMALDVLRGIAYVSTGSPHPNFSGVQHLGRNLFGNSVVALNARTGKRLWHFQEVRHDIWDLDIPAPPVLVTVNRDGKRVDAVAQVTKLGNTLLLDRVTGAPLFPFRLRRAPESKLPGEKTWPYQPDLEFPQPFARQVFTKDDVTNLSEPSRNYILDKISKAKYGWFEPFLPETMTVFYGIHGGAEWTGASFDPETGYLYVSSNQIPWIVTVTESTAPRQPATLGGKVYVNRCAVCHGEKGEGGGKAPPLSALKTYYNEASLRAMIEQHRNAMPAVKVGPEEMKDLLRYLLDDDPAPGRQPGSDKAEKRHMFGLRRLLDAEGYPGSRPPWGTLNAIDLNSGKLVWQVPLGEYEELTRRGMPPTGTENFGGATATAGGLVFCAGARDHKIRAFDKKTGKQIWQRQLPFGGYAPPAVYSAAGRQFVVIAATGGGKLGDEVGDAYVAFALPPDHSGGAPQTPRPGHLR